MGKYVVKEIKTGFKFDLKASNGETIATSEVYSSESSCLNGVESLKKNAPIANLEDQTEENAKKAVNPKFEVYADKAGEFRFRMKAKNGEIIVASEGYKSKASCMDGIESVRKNAGSEVVKEKEAAKGSGSAAKSSKAPQTKSSDKAAKTSQAPVPKESGGDKKTGGFWAAVKRFFGRK